jgi:hypothetical protein
MKMIGTSFWRETLFKSWQQLLVIGLTATALSACGPGLDSLTPNAIGGTLAGLSGTVVLQNNGGDNLSLSANGSFSFSKALSVGAAYAVTVLTQPSGQVCTVSSGSGTATSEVTTVSVQCVSGWTGSKQLGAARVATIGQSIAIDAIGNIYVAGQTSGGLDGNTLTGTMDFFVTKYDSAGVKQYTRQLGVAGATTYGASVATDASGNVYVAGHTDAGLDGNTPIGARDCFVTKYNSSGVKQYTRQLGVADGYVNGTSVATDANGNVYVAGVTFAGLDGNTLTGTADFFVTKYNNIGVKQYTRQLGVVGAETYGNSVATDASGNVYVAGYTKGGLDGNTLTGTMDFFVTKFDSAGVKQYTRQLGVAGATTFGASVATDASGNIYVTGYTDAGLDNNTPIGAEDFFVTKYNSSGARQYTRQLGVAGGYTDGASVVTDVNGNVYVTGVTSGGLDSNTQTGTSDFFVTKFDSAGVKQYTRQLGVAGADTNGNSVATDASANIYVAGNTLGGLDGNTLIGTSDSFVTKYSSSGVKQ